MRGERIPTPVTRSLARNDGGGVGGAGGRGGGTHRSRPTGCGAFTGRTESSAPTKSVIARSAATRQSVLPSPKRRIPTPVCTPRALASRRALARNDSAPRWERRDTWVPPYRVRRSSRADRVVRPYKAEQEPCETGRRGRRPLRNHKGRVQRGGRRHPPLQSRTGAVRNGTAGTACPTNRRRAARTAKFRIFFFPLSASAGLRRLYSDDTGRPPVL